MDSPQEHERKYQDYVSAIDRARDLESKLAQSEGLRAEVEQALSREQTRAETLQLQRDSAIARVVEVETGMRGVASWIVALAKPTQPHRDDTVEELIAKARTNAVQGPAGSLSVVGSDNATSKALSESTPSAQPQHLEAAVPSDAARAA